MNLELNEIQILKNKLTSSGFSFSPMDHAWWKASHNKGHIIAYKSGKILIQANPQNKPELEKLVQGCLPQEDKGGVLLGLDESGKGDFFGPLVLAAALVNPEQTKGIKELGIIDSKKMDDNQIRKLYPALSRLISIEVTILNPEIYNQKYSIYRNLNLLLVDEYSSLINKFSGKMIETVILDKFSQSELQNRTIRKACPWPLKIEEKAERYPAVAAASVAARFHFLKWYDEQTREYPRGSSTFSKELFLKLKEQMPTEEFNRIAKSHFLQG